MNGLRRPLALWLPAPVLWLGAIALVAALAAAGWLLGSRVRERPEPAPAAPLHVRAGGLDLRADAVWGRLRAAAAAPVPGFPPDAPALAPYPGLPTVVRSAVLPTRNAALLPPELAAAAGRRRAATVAGHSAWRYADLQAGRWIVDAAVIPTTRGVITLACSVRATQPAPPGDCLSGLQTVTPLAGKTLAPTPRVALQLALPDVLPALGDARRAGAAGLRARSSRRQAGAADRLARAHERAAAKVAPLEPAAGAGAGLSEDLRAVAAAYGELAAAGRRRDRAAWDRGRAGLARAERGLERTLAALRASPAA